MSLVFSFLSPNIRGILKNISAEHVTELRLRQNKPICICLKGENVTISKEGNISCNFNSGYVITKADIKVCVDMITMQSPYAFKNEIKHGFITLSDGCRVGVCGTAVVRDDDIVTIKDITGLNFRIAHEIIGVSDRVMSNIYSKAEVNNTLIISPPGCGKTTMLRDVARNLSSMGKKVVIIDERGEIAGDRGEFDLGPCTDVLSLCPKERGMRMMLRTMSPEIIITDEIGSESEVKRVVEAMQSGVSVISSMHGFNIKDAESKIGGICKLFKCIITLSFRQGVGTIEDVITYERK